jgi:hypothetical protein
MVLGSKTGESLYIPRVTEEREILSKIDSADGNLISQLKDDIVKILEIHKRLANNEGFILSGDQTDDIMKKHLNVFYDTKSKLFRVKLSNTFNYMRDFRADQVYLKIFDTYKEVCDLKVSFQKELLINNLVALPGEDIICLKDKDRENLYNKISSNSVSDDELLDFILKKLKKTFESSLCIEMKKTNLSKSGEYQRVQNLFKNKRISLEELNKSPFYVDMVSQVVMKQLKRYYFEYQHGFDYICDDYFWSFSPNDCVELFKDDNLGTVLKSEQIRESLKPMLKEYLLNRGEKFGIEETVVSFIKIDHLLSKIIEADIKRFEYLSEILSEELSKIQPKNLSLELTEFGYRSSIKNSYKGLHRGLLDKTVKEFNEFTKYLFKHDKKKAAIFVNLVDVLFETNLYLEYHLVKSSQDLYVNYLNLRKNILGTKNYYFVVDEEVEDKIGFDKIKTLNTRLKSKKIKLNFLLNNFYYIDESTAEFSASFIKGLFGLIEKNQNILFVKKATDDIVEYLPESVELRVVNKEQTPRTITMLLAEFKEDNS